jgi:alpha-soluble NSF attachment protein
MNDVYRYYYISFFFKLTLTKKLKYNNYGYHITNHSTYNIIKMSDAGNRLMNDGEKIYKGFAFFESREDIRSRAREKFLSAATQYKVNGLWYEAGKAYVRSSEVSIKNKSDIDLANDLREAGNCYKKANMEFKEYYEKAIEVYEKLGKTKEVADLCVQIGDNDRAIKHYRNIGFETVANEISLKLIEAKVETMNFFQAANDYENYASKCLDSRLQRGSARKYFFLSLLCHMASISKTDMMESTERLKETFEKYKELDTQFNEFTREYMFIDESIIALENEDLDKFESACFEYDEICPIDKQRKILLDKCREIFSKENDEEDCR